MKFFDQLAKDFNKYSIAAACLGSVLSEVYIATRSSAATEAWFVRCLCILSGITLGDGINEIATTLKARSYRP